MLAIWSFVRPNSFLISGISGAAANHAKKQTKNASHVTWNALICGVDRLNRWMRAAFGAVASMGGAGNSMEDSSAVGERSP